MTGELAVFVLPMVVAVAVPAGFLYAVRRLDLYSSGGFSTVALCFAGGLAAFPVAFAVNTLAYQVLGASQGLGAAAAILVTKTVVAPVVEEVVKASALVYSVRRRDFTFFVDGAIFGFAAGTGFAIFENLFYVRSAAGDQALGLSVNRVLSTALMHGTASALVGVSLGRFRFSRGGRRLAALASGCAVAIALHMAFNRVVSGAVGMGEVVAAMGIGFAGLATTAGAIRLGLREERAWLRETLGLGLGVSRGEAAVIHRIEDLGPLLHPVEARFGREKRDQVERLLLAQARLGLKRKAADRALGPAERAAFEGEIRALRSHVNTQRRKVGIYCMSFVRSILPPQEESLWQQLEQAIASARETDYNIWQTIGTRAGGEVTPPCRGSRPAATAGRRPGPSGEAT